MYTPQYTGVQYTQLRTEPTPMLRDRLLRIVLNEVIKELDSETDTIKQNNPEPRGSLHMISTGNTAPLFFSPNEEKIIDLLKVEGPMRQNAIIQRLELEINSTTIRELLANLVKRRVIHNGPDGYELLA